MNNPFGFGSTMRRRDRNGAAIGVSTMALTTVAVGGTLAHHYLGFPQG